MHERPEHGKINMAEGEELTGGYDIIKRVPYIIEQCPAYGSSRDPVLHTNHKIDIHLTTRIIRIHEDYPSRAMKT